MESTNIIAILLFIIPGVVMQKICNRMDMPTEHKGTEFGELINSILASLPIIIVSGLIIGKYYGYTTLTEISSQLNDLSFIMKFGGLSLTFAIILGIIVGIYKDKVIKIINFIRLKIFNRVKIDDKSCWRKIFLDANEPKYLEISIDGKTYKGVMDKVSLPHEEKEIVLYTPEEWADYPDIEEKFKKVKNVYINIEKNIVIKDYDINEYNKYCEKLIEELNVKS